MDKLQKVVIYKIKNINYFGSTVNYKERRHRHRHNTRKKINTKLYNYLNENNIIPELEIIKILFLTKTSGRFIEQEYIEKYNTIENGLNQRNAFTNSTLKKYITRKRRKEYRKRDYVQKRRKKYIKEYNLKNKEKIKLQAKLWRLNKKLKSLISI